MADRWNLFVDYVREYHGFGRMELITPDVVIAYGERAFIDYFCWLFC